MGWFFGFKLHLVINHLGEIMSFKITDAITDDRKPIPSLMKKLKGWLFADKGYIGQKFYEDLKKQGIEIFTKVKKNMKQKIITPLQKWFLKKRGIIETVFDQLKNVCQIEHTRHRSPTNAMVNVVAGLVMYQIKQKNPYPSCRISTTVSFFCGRTKFPNFVRRPSKNNDTLPIGPCRCLAIINSSLLCASCSWAIQSVCLSPPSDGFLRLI
jgi:hypothetical protein